MVDRVGPTRSRHALRALGGIALCLCLSPASSAELPGQGEDHGRIVLYRDTWGVAHIYAPTVEGGLYAMGWGQAEDRPEQLLLNLLMGIGEYAGAVGEEGVAVDLRSRMFDHYAIAKRGFPELRPELRSGITAFVAGINDFYAAHPSDVPAWWQRGRAVDEAMILASGRMFLFNWSIDEAYGDLKRAGVEPSFEAELRGSNQFAIAPSRSAEGAAILAIDPHLSWYGPSRYWEVRIHAGALEGSGVSRAASPYLGLGHTRNLAWAMTTGGPDTADVYALELDEAGARYRYDGAWRDLERRETTIEVYHGAPRRETILLSHQGPLIAKHGTKAWAAKIAYFDVATAFEAIWELNFGADYKGAERAMALRVLFPQNVMVADTSGNIYYQRTGRVPKRPAGVEPSLPLDGTTSATEWQGLHDASEHLQVLNPPQGFMQNCNIPPDAMMPGNPFHLDRTLPYLFASLDYGPRRDGWTNQRGARAIELLAADDSVTAEEAMSYITDVHPFGADRWVAALRAADQRAGADFASRPHYTGARDALLAWDGALDAKSTGALVYAYFRDSLATDLGTEKARQLAARIDDLYAVVEARAPRPLALDAATDRVLITALASAAKRLVGTHGSLAATYGDRFRVGRGERSWPVEGGGEPGSEGGTTTLRNMGYTKEREDRTRWGERGQTSTQIVVMSKPPRSWLYIPLGQSDRPESPHFSDQAEKAFSPRRLKPSWWLPEDLAGHVESRTVLEPSRALP
jgi:acyl-homoserine lactone acylase PvdQ